MSSTKFCESCISRRRGICAFFDQGCLEDVARKSVTVSLPSKQILRDPNTPSEFTSILLYGVVKASTRLSDGREQILYFLRRNQMWNLTIPVDDIDEGDNGDGFFIESVGPVKICKIPTAILERAAQKNPALITYQEKVIARRLAHMRRHLVLLGKKTALERVASFLLETYRLQSVPKSSEKNGKVRIYIPMSRTDVANYLGLSLETVSRAFAALRKKGLIDSKSKQEVWADLVGLQNIEV